MNFVRSNFIVIITALATTLIGASAKASILIEPYAGYSSETLALELANNTGPVKFTMGGLDYGARLGYAFPMVFIAADYNAATGMASTIGEKPASAAGYTADPFDRTDIFAVVGVRIPMLQAYVGYGFSSSLTYKLQSGEQKFTGTSFKAGLGYTGLPFVAVNLEYLMTNYTKYNSANTDYSVGDTANGAAYSKASGSAVMLNVSVPFHWH
jgi:hypothetical protein